MKRSTASDTATKKSKPGARWFRLATPKPELPELDHIMDLYWGGPERRITGITVRIITVNAIALVILMFGILYLGQYQKNIITARLETFETEMDLITSALEQSISINETGQPVFENATQMAPSLNLSSGQDLRIFDKDGQLIIHAQAHNERRYNKEQFQSIETLKNMAGFILELMPDHRTLPDYPNAKTDIAKEYPDVPEALDGRQSVSVWQTPKSKIFLSAAAPLAKDGEIYAALLLTRDGREIEEDIGDVWIGVLKVFSGTLVLTIMLSIYLSGVIAQPLKKLAKAAEAVRTGQATASDIPDMSHRYDEIGELSVVLRQMTQALWERMDSIEQFAADVSHELKNPLTSLRSAIETASVVKKAADRKKLMDILKHDVERLDRLITDISNASRIDAELSREEFEKISLKAMMSNILSVYADPLKRKDQPEISWHQEIKTDTATIALSGSGDADIYVWGLEGRLAQVFQNLLSNALSFTPKNGKISILVTPSRKHVGITVEDEGPGIPQNRLKTVFERFYSERPDHEHYGHHSGLGLSICKQIIEAHGGQIFAENGKTCGARFTVILNKV